MGFTGMIYAVEDLEPAAPAKTERELWGSYLYELAAFKRGMAARADCPPDLRVRLTSGADLDAQVAHTYVPAVRGPRALN